MLIEQTTTYAYKLKYLENPSFDKVKNLAKKFIDELPQELVDDLYNSINRGVDILKTEPEMLVYLYSFGNMHQAKLNKAFENIPEILFDQPEINIIDYGCGQAIGTMCYVDCIKQKGVSQKVKRVTLIEPSEICLKRAALHVSKFCPDAEIVTVNKTFDDLNAADIVCDEEIPTLHILSNVLDLLDFDLERFVELISDNLKGYNQFVCVGPYFGFSDKDKRMENLCVLLNGDENFCQFYDKYELNHNRPWTAQIWCFSVGELEEKLSTKVTDEDIENGVKDEFGVIYSRDGKRLLKCKNKELKIYIIKNGTKVICGEAFEICKSLQQITIPNSVTSIGINPFVGCLLLTLESQSFRFIVDHGLLIDRKEHSIISYIGNSKNITIPNSVMSIGDWAFYLCGSLQQITIPNSVTSIGDMAFFCCSSLQHITMPNSVTRIGNMAFYVCKSLQQITILNSITSIGISPFSGCSSLTLESQSLRFIIENVFLIDRKEQTIISYIGDNDNITIPNSVTSIGASAFGLCKSLQHITIPNSVTSIGNVAFGKCESLQQITIPNSVTSIGESPFYDCKSLRQITIPNSVTSIGKWVFDGCTSLQQIIIPEGSEEKFKQMLPEVLWDKLYYLKKAIVQPNDEKSGNNNYPF